MDSANSGQKGNCEENAKLFHAMHLGGLFNRLSPKDVCLELKAEFKAYEEQ